VIIAAFAARGLCHALFEYCLESHEVLTCEEILDEIREKLITKVKVPASLASDIEKYIRDSTELVSPQTLLVPELKDNRDRCGIRGRVSHNRGCSPAGASQNKKNNYSIAPSILGSNEGRLN
jgi:hypothetical protein